MKYFLFFLLTIIIIVTFLSLDEELTNITFSNDSGGYLSIISSINITVSMISFMFFYFFIIKKIRYHYFLLFVLIIIWLFSGRRISIRTEKCRVSTGWFFIKTNSFSLCKLADCDCENVYYKTTYEKLSFWRIRIKNTKVNKTIFIGPIVWSKVIAVLKDSRFSDSSPPYNLITKGTLKQNVKK